ncbi:hypothetical protein PR202_ga22188 [Eleusine coracana subsp. coracana]|uniref:DUF3444 domain-containing protein n=1 Tax=Eleusine coracana subsp. coracana TaxID=191504 RepID=A0AAV5D2X3_ELECO|nr:hypothetical protein PR202_ga22188 [Eleusine coracana subsp. coracana]
MDLRCQLLKVSPMMLMGTQMSRVVTAKKMQRNNYSPSNVDYKEHIERLCSNMSSANRQSALNYESRNVNIRDSTETNAAGNDDSILAEATRTACRDSEAISVPHPGIMFRDVNSIFKCSGQIWALFDNLDRMPRFYAHVKYIDESNSKVHVNWWRYVVKKKEDRKWTSDKALSIA